MSIRSILDWRSTFKSRYDSEFGFHLPDRDIFIDDFRVRGEAKSKTVQEKVKNGHLDVAKISEENLFVNGKFVSVPVFNLKDLNSGWENNGPALILCGTSTTVVEPGWKIKIDKFGDIYLHKDKVETLRYKNL